MSSLPDPAQNAPITATLPSDPFPIKEPPRTLSSKPSWIGPLPQPRTKEANQPTMKSHVRLTYSSPGLCPPVYVITSMSEPQWEPVEMDHTQKEDGHFHFSKEFDAEEGQHQYKYRLGPGDWWALDESKQTVDDGFGNRNNLINVEPFRKDSIMPAAIPHKQEPTEQSKPTEQPKVAKEPASADQANSQPELIQTPVSVEQPKPAESSQSVEQPLPIHFSDVGAVQQKTADSTEVTNLSSAPLLRHETQMDADADAEVVADDATPQNDIVPTSADVTEDDDAPLLAHENTLSPSMVQPEEEEDFMDDEPSHYDEEKRNTENDLNEDDGVPLMRHETSPRAPAAEQFEQDSPLLRHETAPSNFANTAGEDSAPLFRHESMGPENDGSHSDRRASAASSAANPLGAINETEEEMETPEPEEVDYSNGSAPVIVEAAVESDGKLDQLISDRFEAQTASTYHIHKHTHKHQQSHTGPIELLTPPMTPDMRESDLVEEERFQPFPSAVSEPSKDVPSVTEQQDEIVKKDSPAFESMEIDEQSDKAKSIFATIKELFLGLGTWFAGLLGGPARATGVAALAVGVAAAVYRYRETRESVASIVLGAAYPHAKGVRRADGPGVRIR
ncbi:hypothetical protein MBLNU457_4142t1 [Dothideomycetes sp. NU457]